MAGFNYDHLVKTLEIAIVIHRSIRYWIIDRTLCQAEKLGLPE